MPCEHKTTTFLASKPLHFDMQWCSECGALRTHLGIWKNPGTQIRDTILARLVIAVLDAQKKYFKGRNKQDLIASKELEKQLRERATAMLEGAI